MLIGGMFLDGMQAALRDAIEVGYKNEAFVFRKLFDRTGRLCARSYEQPFLALSCDGAIRYLAHAKAFKIIPVWNMNLKTVLWRLQGGSFMIW